MHAKRSPEEFVLRTGDYEVASAPSVRPNPFYRQEAHGYPGRVPAAPLSLAPMSMNADDSQAIRGYAHTSRSTLRESPTWRTGTMLLLGGILLGGAFGVGAQARRNAQQATQQIQAAAAAVVAKPAEAPVAPPPAVVQPFQPNEDKAESGRAAPVTAPTVVTQAASHAAKAPAKVVAAPARRVAVAVMAPPPAPAPAPTAKATRPVVVAKAAPPPPKVAEPAPRVEKETAPTKADSDAHRVLQAAMGETANTL